MANIAAFAGEHDSFDRIMLDTLAKWRIPGAQLVIGKNGSVISNRCYGFADIQSGEEVLTNSLFRIGSVSKTLTTAAILKLVDSRLLSLEDKAFRILDDLRPPTGASVDPRIYQITIKHLLQHKGGWERFDALELPWSRMAAATLGEKDPPAAHTIVSYMLSVPLDFDPGQRQVYSNFGFCVLGRVIEKVASKAAGKRVTYEEYLQEAILKPAGINSMRIGRTLPSERAEGEVKYYSAANQPLTPSVFPGCGYVPFAYGGLCIESTDASGGWIASAYDLVRFLAAIQRTSDPLLERTTAERMVSTSDPLCWTIAKRTNGVDFWHVGAIKDSNAAWLARCSNGVLIAVTFNSLPADHESFLKSLLSDLLQQIQTL